MTADRQTFTAPESVATMAKIVDFITSNDAVETGPIIALVGLTPKRVGEYLRYAAEIELIHRLPRRKRIGRFGTNALRWRIGPAPDAVPEPEVDDRKCGTAKYDPIPVSRDPLHAFLFGVPLQKG